MLLIVQDSLVQMAQAPALGHIEMEDFRKLFGSFPRDGVPPGPEGNEQVHLLVKRKITVHHGADAKAGQLFQRNAIAIHDILFQVGIAGLQAVHDVFFTVCPDTVNIIVLPLMTAGGDHIMIFVDQNALDPCGTEFNTEDSVSVNNLIFAHDNVILPYILWKFLR